MSGSTARMIARHRPSTPIVAVSPNPETQRRLALVWGVECLPVPEFADTESMIDVTLDALRPRGLTMRDTIVITAGVPFGSSGATNLIQVRTGKS
jgi:pyruvate kinase